MDDPFYNVILNSYIEKGTEFNVYCQNVASNIPKGTFMNLYALMFQQVLPQKGMNFNDFKTFRLQNLFLFTDLKNPLVANIPLLLEIYRSYLYYNIRGIVTTDLMREMQDKAKVYVQFNAVSEILEAINIKDFRPQVQVLRDKLIKDINFDLLHLDNEAWFSEINEILAAYDKSAPYHHLFGKDVIIALERTKKPEAYSKLAEAAFSITEQFNWGDAQSEIIDYLIKTADNRLQKGSKKVAQIYASKNIQRGKQAPDLVINECAKKVNGENKKKKVLLSKYFTQNSFKKTLLIFYQSDCVLCEEFMHKLVQDYHLIKEKSISVSTLSVDESEEVFTNASSIYPWVDKYCDYEGKKGINFKNYAVVGTPTIFLIDSFGKIEAKLGTMKDVLNVIK